ncbi:hypothetical protein C6P77_15455 [Burkholderia ambifaria]|nr:hypothetical protein C6P77_15455 [Burkholderia ambifaria]
MIVSLEMNSLTRLVHFGIFARVVPRRRQLLRRGDIFCPFWTNILFSALMVVRTAHRNALRVGTNRVARNRIDHAKEPS